ncbi:MAG: phosphate ABC transporter permease PstA [Planctomycetales bacterium]|nr:phosphate ABC transporter permease PstA [Planctomycetales bacterium]
MSDTRLPTNGRPFAKFVSGAFATLCALCTGLCLLALAVLLWQIFSRGWSRVDWSFITDYPSRLPEKSGIVSSLVGSLYLIGLTALFAVPIGVGAAIYLEEYAPATRWRKLIQTNIANLAGVPSIVYGILGLGLFVRYLGLNRSVLAGALTLTLVVLPIVILSAQEALRAVPRTIRQASYALGATRWQTVWHQLLPAAMPGILTGVILALSRALGEAAPLVAIGAATYVRYLPTDLINDDFSALPLQIFSWTDKPQEGFHEAAAAGIVVLLSVLIAMNALAVFLRYRFSKRIQW